MSLLEKARRIPPLGWVALFALAMLFPGLGSFGFWEPWELSLADRARDIARGTDILDPTAGGRYGAEPPLDAVLSALGMKIFGVREFGARLFHALAAVLTLGAVYWGGLGLFRRRAALLAVLALGTTPLFFLQARQLTSDMPLVAGLALSLGGLGRFAWPADGRRSLRDLGVAALGLALGLLSGGALLGVALPCLAVVGAVVVGFGLSPRGVDLPATALTARGAGPDVREDRGLGGSLLAGGTRGKAALALVALVGLGALVVTLTTANIAGQYSLLLGGTPRGGTPVIGFEYLVKQLGFGLFPWSAVAVFALGRPLIRLGDGEGGGGRLAFSQLYLLVFAAFGFALSTIFILMTGDARYPALAAIALAVGSFLDEALEGERAEPVLGLLVATGTMVVARDFFLEPENLVSVHLLNKVKWPPTLTIGWVFLAVGVVVGAGIYTGLATRGRALGRVAERQLGDVPPWRHRLERVVVEAGRYGIQAAVVAAIVFAAFVAHGLVPHLSRHFSFKPVLESFTRFAKEGEEIGKYRVEGHGAAFYSSRDMVELPTQDRVVEFLRQPKRAFALVPAEELAALDAAIRSGRLDYFVVDASSSRFLLLSNRLGEGEEDKNPLKKNVWMAPRPPELVTTPAGEGATAVQAGNVPPAGPERWDWHGAAPPWQWRVPVQSTFGSSIELVGADFPESIRRPAKLPVTLHFRVNNRPPGSYKVFIHLDGQDAPRLNGDHIPLDGAFPTTFWLPGEYIRDRFEIDVPLMTQPAGTYVIYVGFWPGGETKRLPITAGPNDGFDRARVGVIEIR